jgi:lipopolysaccharide export system protein LptA
MSRTARPAAPLAALVLVAATLAAAAQGTGTDLFKGFGTNGREPIQIEADSLEVRDLESYAVFSGNVHVRQKDTTLKTARLKVFYIGRAVGSAGAGKPDDKTAKPDDKAAKPDDKVAAAGAGPSAQKIDRFEAEGKVVLTQLDANATADSGRFDMQSQQAVLTGSVVLTKGRNVARGDRLTVDLRSGQYKLDGGRIRMEIETGGEIDPKAGTAKPAAKP